jgi:hypothetical protein
MSTVTFFGRRLNLTVAADLPFWANTIQSASSTAKMDRWTLGLVDSATFMTYRSDAAQLLDIAGAALAAGDAEGKPVWLAVETTDVGDERLSYFGKSASKLAADLETVQIGAQGHASFAGIAVHDSVGWPALK